MPFDSCPSEVPSELLEIIGIVLIIAGFPVRWEAVHMRNVAFELRVHG